MAVARSELGSKDWTTSIGVLCNCSSNGGAADLVPNLL